MTTKTVRVIRPEDLAQITFRCRECKASLTATVATVGANGALMDCPACRKQWTLPIVMVQRIREFLELVEKEQGAEIEFHVPVTATLEEVLKSASSPAPAL